MTGEYLPCRGDGALKAAFEQAGVGSVVDEVDQWICETVALARSGTVLASRPVIETLVDLDYDPADHVFVVWRAEGRQDFWTQARKDRYIESLRTRVAETGKPLNQRRLMVYDDRLRGTQVAAESWNVMTDDHIFHALSELHPKGTFAATSQSTLSDYPLIEQLRFGFTVSERHGYVVIPVPLAEDLQPSQLSPEMIGSYLAAHRDYDLRDGPMRAVICVEPTFVRKLLDQTRELFRDPAVEPR